MIVKAFVATALVAAPLVASDASAQTMVNYPKVSLADCGASRGTAFIAGGRTISAHHVTDVQCYVDGVPLHQVSEDGLDFSSEPAPIPGYRINCEGFKEGETYFAIGHAHGLPVQTMITLAASSERNDVGMVFLIGWPTVIPGMSGGPILNAQGEVVGIVNMYNKIYPLSMSRELKDTSLCR